MLITYAYTVYKKGIRGIRVEGTDMICYRVPGISLYIITLNVLVYVQETLATWHQGGVHRRSNGVIQKQHEESRNMNWSFGSRGRTIHHQRNTINQRATREKTHVSPSYTQGCVSILECICRRSAPWRGGARRTHLLLASRVI